MRTLEFILKMLGGLIVLIGTICSYLFVASILVDYIIMNDILIHKIFDVIAAIFLIAIYIWVAMKYLKSVLDIIKNKKLWKRKN